MYLLRNRNTDDEPYITDQKENMLFVFPKSELVSYSKTTHLIEASISFSTDCVSDLNTSVPINSELFFNICY